MRMRVWSKQHESVLQVLDEHGRYTAHGDYLYRELGDLAPLVLEVYNWLAANHPQREQRPPDAVYPIWLSYTEDAVMRADAGTVILELEVDEAFVTPIDILKWGTMLNYSYIPLDETDAAAHKAELEAYGISDAKAYMSAFYPAIKRQIEASWRRLFDDTVSLGGDASYGTIWEINESWIKNIRRP